MHIMYTIVNCFIYFSVKTREHLNSFVHLVAGSASLRDKKNLKKHSSTTSYYFIRQIAKVFKSGVNSNVQVSLVTKAAIKLG